MASDTPIRSRAVRASAALWHGVVLCGLAIWEALSILWLATSATLLLIGVGIFLVPGALENIRTNARRQRRHARDFSSVEIVERYRPFSRTRGLRGSWSSVMGMLRDDATWRDLLWHILNPIIGACIAIAPIAGVLHGIWGIVLLAMWRPVVAFWENSWFVFIPLRDEQSAYFAAGLGLIEIIVFAALAPAFIRLHARWAKALLGRPSAAALAARVEALTGSRAQAMDLQAAEVRRIERDLHDGAQARLVAMGMTIAAASRVLDSDPEAAKALLGEAKANSATALDEIRNLVRGIHPPVLSDRGLVEALRALALEIPLPPVVRVESTLTGRLGAPIESAAYFAASELITNAVKHAQADGITVAIAHRHEALEVTVTDDGIGGAISRAGTGIEGITRRLDAFDGRLEISSPPGGPTIMSFVMPCEVVDLASDGRARTADGRA